MPSSNMIIDPLYSIGISEIDAQHAKWIDLVHKFQAAASGHLFDAIGFQAASVALEKLLTYTQNHFACEEQVMADHGWKQLEAHKKLHRELEAKVRELLEEIRVHSANKTPLKLNLLVTIWVLEHILQEDVKYAKFVLGTVQ